MLLLPTPDIRAAFRTRLSRLLRTLSTELVDDQNLVLVLPASSDPEHLQWLARIETERKDRPHLNNYHLSIARNPGFSQLPWTIGTALRLVDEGLDDLAQELEAEVLFCVEKFIEKKLQPAVLARPEIVQQWPRPRETGVASAALHALTSILRIFPKDEPPSSDPLKDEPSSQIISDSEDEKKLFYYYWPGEAAPLIVAKWAQKVLNEFGMGDALVEEARHGMPWMPPDLVLSQAEKPRRIPVAGLALLYLAEQDIQEKRRRPAIAIDASKTHHDLVGGMKDWPRDGMRHRGSAMEATIRAEDVIDRVELLSAGSTTQLQIPLPEMEGMQDHAIEALRRLRGAKGLRHWAALLKLFSVEGGRSGTYRWLLSEHLAAMGYDERQRRDPKVQAEAAHEVEALASLELAIYTEGGVLRERRKLLLETGRYERLVGTEYQLDGIEFQMNQRVYGGVRASTGEIGQKWMPAPVALAAIDHIRFPYAHSLGMLLAIRFRWRLDEQADFLAISGSNLLSLAGIVYEKRREERTWKKLEHTLDILKQVEQIDRYEWTGGEWTLGGICRIYASQWLADRAGRGVIPDERPPDKDRPVTGGELKAWREKRGWSQRQAAKELKVGQSTLSNAEASPEEPLTPRLMDLFRARAL